MNDKIPEDFYFFADAVQLGQHFKAAREKEGLTQEQVSELVTQQLGKKLSRSTIIRMERGEHMKMENVFSYAAVIKAKLGLKLGS